MAPTLDQLQKSIAAGAFCEEVNCVRQLAQNIELNPSRRARIAECAGRLIRAAREQKHNRSHLDAFLDEFGLGSQEGIALMCLAEALLRIPDLATADRLIREKLLQGDWQQHLGNSPSLFVKAATRGLLLGRSLLKQDTRTEPGKGLKRLRGRASDAVLRRATLRAMGLMADHYILGRDIDEALQRIPKEYPADTLFSFDALGEGARSQADAERHWRNYESLIDKLAVHTHGLDEGQQHGISIKLSALHPRYQWTQKQGLENELLPRLITLATAARKSGVALSIDAEESERLDICLTLFEKLALHESLRDWSGLGFVLQAYQKRAPLVADYLIQLANERKCAFNVRLVKGAYWDREIKRGQQLGLADYPVFTRKANTDLAYLVCAERLLAAGPDCIYPQFATHNAATIASILELAGDRPFELQRLHGMGELLYAQLLRERKLPVRVYAPVGSHPDLLPYLVRRLLENGANSSFVNHFLDESLPIEELAMDPLTRIEASEHLRNPKIPPPAQLFRQRANSSGLDLENPAHAEAVLTAGAEAVFTPLYETENSTRAVHNPARLDECLGHYREAKASEVGAALTRASEAQAEWDRRGGAERATLLEAVAAAFEQHKLRLITLIAREAGRSLVDAEAEVREAIDFCHYYAQQARRHFALPQTLEGPTGEDNCYSLHGRGVFLCISPWNFPMAIFIGQVSAALAAGNTVIAKPAEQTTLIARELISLMRSAGLPPEVVQLVPGEGERLGPVLLADPRLAGVAFTGSTGTAHIIHRQLAERPGPIIPFIAETGGINTMLVDSTALAEQVVDDVLRSAFYSAGQRCSALRVLYLQEETADQIIEMLRGACDQLRIGDPTRIDTDIGPIIDAEALENLQDYVKQARKDFEQLYAFDEARLPSDGYFFGPQIFAVKHLTDVKREVFGPVLHIIRYRAEDLDQIISDINASGYGLTLGIHSRIQGWTESIFQRTRVGNTYINRNMIGAVVGVQPFGGHNLSGTGPKAGGPHYLFQFAAEKVLTVNTVATGGNASLLNLGD